MIIEDSSERQTKLIHNVKKRINLEEIGIKDMRIRKERTRTTIMELEGESGDKKANKLTKKLLELRNEHGKVRIRRPCKVVEIRIRGVENTVSKDEVTRAMEAKWGRPLSNYMVKNVVISRPRVFWGRVHAIWVKYLLELAEKLIKDKTLTIR